MPTTYPGPCPDVAAQLEDGEGHHEVDAGRELDPAAHRVDQPPGFFLRSVVFYKDRFFL